MINIYLNGDQLLLEYSPEQTDPRWIQQKFDADEPITVRRTFHLRATHLLPPEDEPADAWGDEDSHFFRIGELTGEYVRLDPEVFGTKNTFYFHEDLDLPVRFFIASRNIAILPKIDRLVSEDVHVGGDHVDAVPADEYVRLIETFPNSYELTKYSLARVGACIRDYLDTAEDAEGAYHAYMSRRAATRASTLLGTFRSHEIAKYRTICDTLNAMLAEEQSYNEATWQLKIVDIVRLLYPKYIHVLTKVGIRDTINEKNREIDLLLVDSCGHVDIIEIKQPFDNCIVSKRQYRDNYIPLKELTGTVMQVEKYILYLNKWGQHGEEVLSRRYQDELPEGLRLKVVNPKGIIVMGRELALSRPQREDFEVIKRKYSNVIDIVTYDDLLARLDFTISQLEAGA